MGDRSCLWQFLSAFGLCKLVQVARGVGFTSLESERKLKCSTVRIMPLRLMFPTLPCVAVVLQGTLLQTLPRGVHGPAQAQPSPCTQSDAQHHLQAGKTPRRPPRHQTPGKTKCGEFWACNRPWCLSLGAQLSGRGCSMP